jgi:hypothetical protein
MGNKPSICKFDSVVSSVIPNPSHFSHDNMSQLLGIPSKSFKDTNEAKTNEIILHLSEYIQTLKGSRRAGAGAGASAGTGIRSPNIDVDTDGYPILPTSATWKKISKADLEKMYRSYITIQYGMCVHKSFLSKFLSGLNVGLASGMPKRQAPFTRISQKQTDFLERKYFPRGLILKDPRSMRQEDIIKLFEHAANRQASHGVKDAFRFKAVLSSRKKGNIDGAKYNDPAINPAMNIDGPATASQPEDNAAPVPASTFTFRLQTVPTDHTPLDDSAPVPPRPKKKRNQSGKGKARAVVTASPDMAQDSGSQLALAESISHIPASDHARPRPRPRPTGRAKGTSSEKPAQESLSPISANEQAPAQGPALTLDPGYQWEPQILLDPCLDPAFDRNTSLSLTEPLQASELLPYSFESILTSNSIPPASSSISEPDPPCPQGKGKMPKVSEVPDLERTLRRRERKAIGEKAIDEPDPEHTLGRTLRRREKPVLSMDVHDPEHTPRRKGRKADVLALEEAQRFLAKDKSRRRKKN